GGRRGQPLYDVLRAVAPDVLLVNESPKRPLVGRRDCRRLALKAGLRYVDGGRSAGSNVVAVASGIGVKSSEAVVLPQPFGQPRRGIVSAQLRIEGRLLGVVSCHLSLDAARRRIEVHRVIEVARSLRGPVVVAGDLNERPDGPAWEELRVAGFVDHGDRSWRTFPADRPEKRLDALLVRGDVRILTHGDPGLPADLLARASDHRPVLATLEL
ncbi:MAG: endonuclease/exonuclease/phosphatase family protein, partial [Nocardioidaceae bacterium]